MKYYKDIDVMSLNSVEDMTIEHKEIKHEFERVSMAYRELNLFPRRLAWYLGRNIKFLDLTYNNLRNLEFLSNFPALHTLVLDRNPRLNPSSFPFSPKLKILWVNNCNIINIYDWILEIRMKCPNLQQLSMMCNPVGLTCLNGISQDEEKEYRREIARLLPTLKYFDGAPIEFEQPNKLDLSKVLAIRYTLKKTWQSLWDLQNFKLLENEGELLQNRNSKNSMQLFTY